MNFEVHNAAYLIEREGGTYAPCRLPEEVRLSLEKESGRDTAKTSYSGCEIRFVMEQSAKVHLFYDGSAEYAPKLYLYFGDFQSGWQWLNPLTLKKGENIIEIKYPSNLPRMKEIAEREGRGFAPEVVRLSGFGGCRIGEIEGNVRKPRADELPQKTMMIYGSSITHGSLSQNINAAYAHLTARKLRVDILNKGLAGSCYLEPAMVEYVLGYPADFHVIELGTNCYKEENDGWFRERVKNVLDTHEHLCPEKQLFIIDCFRSLKTEGCFAAVRETLAAGEYSNVTYINGYEILPNESAYTTDMTHPSLDAHFHMAECLAEIIAKKI